MARLVRLYHHIFGWRYSLKPITLLPYRNFILWTGDLLFLLFDVLYFDKIFYIFQALFGYKKRSLTERELCVLKPIFRDSISYENVKLYSKVGAFIRRRAYAFVLFDTINFSKTITDDVLVHEAVHIWQYQRYGSPYILRALLAQISNEKYDYGGIENLYDGMVKGRQLVDFNFEQQGDIVQNGYLQRKGVRGINNQFYEAVYRYYLAQLQY